MDNGRGQRRPRPRDRSALPAPLDWGAGEAANRSSQRAIGCEHGALRAPPMSEDLP